MVACLHGRREPLHAIISVSGVMSPLLPSALLLELFSDPPGRTACTRTAALRVWMDAFHARLPVIGSQEIVA